MRTLITKPLWIFRHLACEGPGYFADFLQRHRIPSHLIAIDEGAAVPTDLRECSALVFMGGPMSVNDDLPWITQELDLIRQAGEIGMPVLGHCLGGQLIAKALGAKVYANNVQEIGWHAVTQAAASSPWLKNVPHSFEAFHWHGETFDLPPGAELLLQSRWCRHQAFAHGKMLALQCHVEMTADMVREWADVHHHQLAHPSASVQARAEMMDKLEQRIRTLQVVADRLYGHWLQRIRGA